MHKEDSVIAYKLMVLTYKLSDLFIKPGRILSRFNIKAGQTVVDYGCGPGRHLNTASELVGKNGLVYAVDINKTAINYVEKRIVKFNLKNVIPVLLKEGTVIAEECADLIYALDMFHQINDPQSFFNKVYNIIKKDGCFYLDDGHQSREFSRDKIGQSGLWRLEEEKKDYLKLRPIKS